MRADPDCQVWLYASDREQIFGSSLRSSLVGQLKVVTVMVRFACDVTHRTPSLVGALGICQE